MPSSWGDLGSRCGGAVDSKRSLVGGHLGWWTLPPTYLRPFKGHDYHVVLSP